MLWLDIVSISKPLLDSLIKFSILPRLQLNDSQEKIEHSEVIRKVDRKTAGNRIRVKEFFGELVTKIDDSDMISELITTEIPLSDYINEFSISKHITEMHVACGYVYKSGLDMIEPAINEL